MTRPRPAVADSPAPGKPPAVPSLDFASKLFGYDLFISFALGPPPRGTQSYASDLARRLRERDFKVFFSEEEAAPGEQLDSTLHKALLSSRALVVIANRGTLEAPRWVRTEVESFRSLMPQRPIVPVSIGGALQAPDLADQVASWLPFQDRIWVDETQAAVDGGLASAAVVDRLALVPRRVRASVKWRWLVRAVVAALALLAVGMGVAAKVARDSEQRARAELMRSTSLGAAGEALAMAAGTRAGGHERALQQVLAAHAIGSAPLEVGSAMLSLVLELPGLLKLLDTGAVLRAVAISPEAAAAHLVTGGAGGRVQRWDARSLQPIGGPLAGPQSEVLAVAYSPDGQRIAAGDLHGRLWLWDARSGEPLARSSDGGGAIRGLAFMPDGRRIVTGGVGGALQFWDAAGGQAEGEPLKGAGEIIEALAISPDGRRMVSGGDFHAHLWTLRGGRWVDASLQRDGEEDQSSTSALAFSPDGKLVASGRADGSVWLWDGITGKAIGGPLRARSAVASLGFSHDGRQLLTGGARGMLQLWDLRERRVVADWLSSQDGAVTALSSSADGRLVASAGEDGLLRLWNSAPEAGTGDVQTGSAKPLPEPACRQAGMDSRRYLAISADCAMMAAAGRDDSLQLLDPRSGQPLGPAVPGHRTGEVRDANAKEPKIRVQSAVFSSDGRTLVSGSQNGTVQRWLTSPLRPDGAPLQGHRSAVRSVALSADGLTIASVDDNGQLRLWDKASGQPIGVPLVDAGALRRVAFSTDGGWIVAHDQDGAAQRTWPAPTRWQAHLCSMLTRDATPEQWRAWLTPEIAHRPTCERPAAVR